MSKKKSLFERMLDAHAPVENVVLETPHDATTMRAEKKQVDFIVHKAGCSYQRHPFVCNCQ